MRRNDKRALRLLVAIGSWCLLGVTAMPSSAAQALNLEEYYQAALQRSEVVANQVELIHQAEERYTQARASLLPSVDALAARTRQERVPSSTSGSSGSLAPYQSSARLTVTQPIFRGFREFAGLRQTQALVGAQNQDYLNARVQLFKDVAQNFYDVLSLEQELKNVDEQLSLNQKRETELRGRVRIGRSRITEVLAVETSISTLRAEAEELRGRLRAAREAFAFLSGLDAGIPLRDTENVPETIDPLTDYLTELQQRPDVKAGQQRVTAADENITVAKGERLPSVDLTGNYYLDRSGTLEDVNWDIQLALTMPLYRGGALQSKVREAASQRNQAELSLSQARRAAAQEVRTAYENVSFNRSQLEALERATEAARRNYEAQSRDYRLGLVTNLDVLQALTVFYDNQRALDRARYAIKLSYLRLQAAAVRRPSLPEGIAP